MPRARPGTRSIAPAASSASRWYCAARTPLKPKAREISACEGGMPSVSMRSAIRARMACWVSVSSMVSSNTTNAGSLSTVAGCSRSLQLLPAEGLQAAQCRGNGLAAYRLAIAQEPEHLCLGVAAAPLPRDPDRAHRLVHSAAARPGDAGDRHGHAGPRMHQRPGHHLQHRFAADCAECFEGFRADAQQRLLGLVAVGGQAAVEPVGGP